METVAEIRSRTGLTQDELASRSGVAQPNIAAYESGRRRASAAMIERLRRAAVALPHEVVDDKRDELLELAAKHGLTDVRLFGSAMRRTDGPGSDVDLLVSASPDTGLLRIAMFANEAEDLLKVRVDVVTDGGLRQGHPIRDQAVSL